MNMVERVARALAKADRIEICSDASYEFSSYGPKARAAIEAMREPTETRGHQPVSASPRGPTAGGPTAAAVSSGPPANPPTQGTSARK